jgi:hypothetical protein
MLSRLSCKKVLLQANLILIFALTLFFMCVPGVAGALELTVSPTGNNSDQTVINQALENVKNAGGGTVYLNAGTYMVDNTVVIWSNTVLTGSPDAVILVSPSSSQWFTGSTGIISCQESVKNVEISGFQINGNLGALPASFANTAGHDKDAERCIILHGNSGDYAENIRISNMKLYDSFSDGMYIYYAKNVKVYNNFISNCQHEGVFWSVVIGGELFNNKVAGITSDCARLDNNIGCRVFDNIFFSYDGTNLNSAYPHGENGLQVGNAGSSHGYDASNKPTVTTNIEIFNNTFANNGLKAILLGSGSDNNVFVHSNKFIGVAELEQLGVSVKGISPTVQQSEKVFSNIFDILKMDYNFVYPDLQQDLNGNVQVLSYKNYSLVDVHGEDVAAVKISYDDKQVTHYLEKDIWIGSLQHQGSRVYLPGSFQKGDLKVTCISNQGFQVVTNFEVIEKQEQSGSINPDVIPFAGAIILFGIALFRNLGRLIK